MTQLKSVTKYQVKESDVTQPDLMSVLRTEQNPVDPKVIKQDEPHRQLTEPALLSKKVADAIREAPVFDPETQSSLEKKVSWKKAVFVTSFMFCFGYFLGAATILFLL